MTYGVNAACNVGYQGPQSLDSAGAFPSLQRRGVCGINQKTRSHRSAADGVVAHTTRFTNAFRNIACERPPRPRLFQNGSIFANGAASLEASPYRARRFAPPLQGGECPQSEICVLVKNNLGLESCRFDPEACFPVAARRNGLEFLVQTLLSEVHGIGDAGHRFEGNEIPVPLHACKGRPYHD